MTFQGRVVEPSQPLDDQVQLALVRPFFSTFVT
jgi:hypothetical protein